MKSKAFVLSMASFSIVLLLAAPAAATTLLFINNTPAQLDASYALSFVATASTMTISISGYQPPSFEYATNNSVTLLGSKQNLLGGYWNFTSAADGTFASTFNDGTAVPGLLFGGLVSGDYDTFSQAVPTTSGDTYVLSFLYSNNPTGALTDATPNGFLVTEVQGGVPIYEYGHSGSATISVSTGVPEPPAWALALLGFAGLAGYRRSQGKISAPTLC